MPKVATEEVRGKAAVLFRTTKMSPEQISEQLPVSASTIRGWIKTGRWRRDYTKVTASKVRQSIATGSTDDLSLMDSNIASDARAKEISGYMETAISNAGKMLNKVSTLIDDADSGQKLKALADTNQKAVNTVRDITDLNSEASAPDAMDELLVDLMEKADEAVQDAESDYQAAATKSSMMFELH
jgi:hypothetical protein